MTTMWALTFDRRRESWDTSRGMVKERVDVPTLAESDDDRRDASHVIVKVRYAGFCGSDRGIWTRRAFGDMVQSSLDQDGQERRIFGHEMLGEIVEVGRSARLKYGYTEGDVVAAESHVVCGVCPQCKLGEYHVCANERILGISMDGVFAEYVKLPAKVLWRTDLAKIRPEVAAVQEPFGNAVHACQTVDLRGKTVAIFGTGTIGLFAVLVARGMGARRVIGIDPDAANRGLARKLGCDAVFAPGQSPSAAPHASDPELRKALLEHTDGVGVDVAMEMSGAPSSLNNAIRATRRGGHIILFGVKNGDTVIEDAHRIVMNGQTLHGVVGRRIFQTWDVTRALLEQQDNGIQEAIWSTLLRRGDDTIVDIADWDAQSFETRMQRHPKMLVRFSS